RPVLELDGGGHPEGLGEDRPCVTQGLHDDPDEHRDPDGDRQPEQTDEHEAERVALRTHGRAAATAATSRGWWLRGEGVRFGGGRGGDQRGHVESLSVQYWMASRRMTRRMSRTRIETMASEMIAEAVAAPYAGIDCPENAVT